MKICVYFIFTILPWISRVGDWALRWTEGNEMVQVFFVMLLFPVVMNALQYYIIDSFIKDQTPGDHDAIPSVDEDDGEERDPLHRSNDTASSDNETAVPASDDDAVDEGDGHNRRSKAQTREKSRTKSHHRKKSPDHSPRLKAGEDGPLLSSDRDASEQKADSTSQHGEGSGE